MNEIDHYMKATARLRGELADALATITKLHEELTPARRERDLLRGYLEGLLARTKTHPGQHLYTLTPVIERLLEDKRV